MIPFLPGRRRDDPASRSHARAIELAAERLSEPLRPEEDAWLEGHLAECDACAAVAAEYEADARLLRSMPSPEAPRDLWARTSAAIEAERTKRGAGSAAGRRVPPLIPLGVLSGALVVGVVVLASLLSSPGLPPVSPSSQPLPSAAMASTAPASTPIAVAAGEVGWVTQRQDGSYSIAYAPVQHVCKATDQPDCAPLAAASPVALALAATPGAIVGAPGADQLVVVDSRTKTTGGAVYVVDIPSPAPSLAPSPVPSGAASTSPSASPAISPSAPASPAASPSAAASSTPIPSPSAAGSSSATPPTLAIIQDVVTVGETGAYSPDGRWFAFSARPADGSQGPDIWVWSPGDALAHPVTTDHRSVFAGWSGNDIIGSRAVVLPDAEGTTASPTGSAAPAGSATASTASPSPSDGAAASASAGPSPVIATPVSFILDPASRASIDIPGDAMWRPVVDPTGTYAVYWQGTIRLADNGVDWVPDSGRLVVARWSGHGMQPPDPSSLSGSPDPGATGSPLAGSSAGSSPAAIPASPSAMPTGVASAAPAAAGSPSSPAPSGSAVPSVSPSPATLPTALSTGPVRDWDARWDDTGTRLAVWLADPVDQTIGTLSLHTLDRGSDTLDASGLLLDQQTALPGFSIGEGRLAWATPPGQGGQDSQVKVLAWTGASAGLIQSDPGQGPGPVVVIR